VCVSLTEFIVDAAVRCLLPCPKKKSHIVFFHINLLKWLLKLKGFHMLSYSDGIRVLRGKKKKKSIMCCVIFSEFVYRNVFNVDGKFLSFRETSFLKIGLWPMC